jgi:hypothetical protein
LLPEFFHDEAEAMELNLEVADAVGVGGFPVANDGWRGLEACANTTTAWSQREGVLHHDQLSVNGATACAGLASTVESASLLDAQL